MNNNLLVLITTSLIADIIASHISDCDLEEGSLHLASVLASHDVDLDFVLVVAGGNKDNLKEVGKLAYEELAKLQYTEEVSRYVHNRNGTKPK